MALQQHQVGFGQTPFVTQSQLTRSSTFASPSLSEVVHVSHSQNTDASHRVPSEVSWTEDVLWDFDLEDDSDEEYISIPAANVPDEPNQSLTDNEMKLPKTKTAIGFLSTLITYVSLNSLYRSTHPNAFQFSAEDAEEVTWMASSKSWFDRKSCRWLGVCGGSHMKLVGPRFGAHMHDNEQKGALEPDQNLAWQNAWTEGDLTNSKDGEDKILGEIPEYVIEHAPLVHLFSGEQFWPCDIAEHLYHITPTLNYTPIQSEFQHPKLKDLDDLNRWEPNWVFLTSNDDPEQHPEWIEGAKNIPVPPDTENDDFSDNDGWIHHPGRTHLQGLKDAAEDLAKWYGGGDHSWDHDESFTESSNPKKVYEKHLEDAKKYLHNELKRHENEGTSPPRIRGGRSDAPAVLIVVDKGHGIVDAFWFFFYSFNLGNSVFNIRFGNHVGDWEHSAVRFHHGKPKAVFFSEHNFGSSYSYEAVEKIGKRPVIYSATGTHAMYATPGLHPYVLPWGILHDETDKGPLWDPVLNLHAYGYDHEKDILKASNLTSQAPTGWFYFAGHWGDKFYPLGDKRQYRFAGQYHYVNGPIGPRWKQLGRKKICAGPDEKPCVIKHWLGESVRVKRWQTSGEEADAFSAAVEIQGSKFK